MADHLTGQHAADVAALLAAGWSRPVLVSILTPGAEGRITENDEVTEYVYKAVPVTHAARQRGAVECRVAMTPEMLADAEAGKFKVDVAADVVPAMLDVIENS